MQPYLFPYIGYYQMIGAVDKFVVYDDVSFIKRGWINRNNILLNGERHLFTVPRINGGFGSLICENVVDDAAHWRPKFLRTIEHAYKKAPQYSLVFPLIHEIVANGPIEIGKLATNSLTMVADYIGLKTEIKESSIDYNNRHLKGEDRVLDICKLEGVDTYINSIGGIGLYSKERFKKEGIDLYFIKSLNVTYPQYDNEFVPSLSIIDVLMFNRQDEIAGLIEQYELI